MLIYWQQMLKGYKTETGILCHCCDSEVTVSLLKHWTFCIFMLIYWLFLHLMSRSVLHNLKLMLAGRHTENRKSDLSLSLIYLLKLSSIVLSLIIKFAFLFVFPQVFLHIHRHRQWAEVSLSPYSLINLTCKKWKTCCGIQWWPMHHLWRWWESFVLWWMP